MRKIITLAMAILPIVCMAQSPKNLQNWSPLVNIYKISFSEAAKLVEADTIKIVPFIGMQPYIQLTREQYANDSLPLGHYVAIWLKGASIISEYMCKSNLNIIPLNDPKQRKITVWDKNGSMVRQARVFVHNGHSDKEMRFDNKNQAFELHKNPDSEMLLKVLTPEDSTFASLEPNDDYYVTRKRNKIREYRRYNKTSFFSKLISQLSFKRKSKNTKMEGFVVLSQPKYKTGDTVKFKAYLMDKNHKPCNTKIQATLEYFQFGKHVSQNLFLLSPTSPGAYIGQFVVGDTLSMDTNYKLLFTDTKNNSSFQHNFRLEEYILKEAGEISFKFSKEKYYRNDTIKCTISAEDANGLPLTGAAVKVIILPNNVSDFFNDKVYIKDTLAVREGTISTDGTITFVIEPNNLPMANMNLTGQLTLTAPNNEVHNQNANIDFIYAGKHIESEQVDDTLIIQYKENGIISPILAELSTDDTDTTTNIQLPYKTKINPLVNEYHVEIPMRNSTLNHTATIESYHPTVQTFNFKDTLSVVIYNPLKLPLSFSILDGNQIISTQISSDSLIRWQRKISNARQAYQLYYSWIWKGEGNQNYIGIGLPYKDLNITLSSNTKIFPGQSDSLRIQITDFKGRAAKNVNLTAASYNNQFFTKYYRPTPLPNTTNYKLKNQNDVKKIENSEDDFSFSNTYPLSENLKLIKELAADTLKYYQLINPKNGFADYATLISSFTPQIAAHVVKSGVPQQVYLLYVNKQLKYYQGSTGIMPYAFEVYPQNVQLGIRLLDNFLLIDSLYLQPNYKHDLFFDLDNLPGNCKLMRADSFWTASEMSLLEGTILRLENHPNNKNSYVWQGTSVTRIDNSNNPIAGPFNSPTIKYYKPLYFDTEFNLERGYRYRLSPKTVRLEKAPMFSPETKFHYLPIIKKPTIAIGDTIQAPPIIYYPPATVLKRLKYDSKKITEYQYNFNAEANTVNYFLPTDSVIEYVVLISKGINNDTIILPNNYNRLTLNEGRYSLYFATSNFSNIYVNDFIVKSNYALYLDLRKQKFDTTNPLFSILWNKQQTPSKFDEPVVSITNKDTATFTTLDCFDKNGFEVSGKIIDSKGESPIPFASVYLAGYNAGTSSNATGEFSLKHIKAGKYMMVVSAIGYQSKKIELSSSSGNQKLKVTLDYNDNAIEEVVVTSAFQTTRVARAVSSNVQLIQGRIAGVFIRSSSESSIGNITSVRLRGEVGEINGENKPIYVIDGIINENPISLNPDEIAEMNVLQAEDAIKLYGSKAENGAIVIKTKRKNFRGQFRDYAFWHPNFFTDNNGKAVIPITYPDNITAWRTLVVGIDKKARTGQNTLLVNAYKPITSQVFVPQFLLRNDTASAINKVTNHTKDDYILKTEIVVNTEKSQTEPQKLPASDIFTNRFRLVTNEKDSVTISAKSITTTGFSDGEMRKIPVLPIGTEETNGFFSVLLNDTSFAYTPNPNSKSLTIFASNNTMDAMLDELEYLKKYPFACMEQTASKLKGLALEKMVYTALGKKFDNENQMKPLLKKVLQAQQFDGGWAWWETGKSNFYITSYITRALLPLRENPAVENSLRNAFLFLNNHIKSLDKEVGLEALYTLSSAGHQMNYAELVRQYKIDSMMSLQQWQYVAILKQQGMPYKSILKNLIQKGTYTYTGGYYTGLNNTYWYGNLTAATLAAFNVLKDEPEFEKEKKGIIQWFLEQKSGGYYTNTVESAGILGAIVPELLKTKANFTSKPQVVISGDTNLLAKEFPFKFSIKNPKNINHLQISKNGGGIVYLTGYNSYFNSNPDPFYNDLNIATSFQNSSGMELKELKSGDRIKLKVSITSKKEANYVMTEIPIPSGCIAINKQIDQWNTLKEYRKDRVYIFIENLVKGESQFYIDLEPRFAGKYTINPAKVSLMYFPTFFARTPINTIVIKE